MVEELSAGERYLLIKGQQAELDTLLKALMDRKASLLNEEQKLLATRPQDEQEAQEAPQEEEPEVKPPVRVAEPSQAATPPNSPAPLPARKKSKW